MNRRDFLNNIKRVSSVGIAVAATNSLAQELVPKDIIVSLNNSSSLKDVFLEERYMDSLKSVRKKLKYVQSYVGYGNFNILSFDDAASILRRSPTAKRFTKEELEFIEHIFYYTPTVHGFYGERITTNLTAKIDKREITKIPYSGHYLFKGKPQETYNHMLKDIGDTLILTSGVRSVVKQMKLFLDKLYNEKGNLSQASNSIAPPAFTYHGIGDFDVGKKGLGASNFTRRFALTDEFTEMKKLKYISMRYTINNKDGVRYEPWHVKII